MKLHLEMFPDVKLLHVVMKLKVIKNYAGDVILFIDEVHNLIGSGTVGKGKGSGLDIGNLLKPALARGELQVLDSSDFLLSATILCRKDHTLLHFLSHARYLFVFLVHCSNNSR
jgi:hypothetical protein